MTSVHTIEWKSLGFHFFITRFLFLPVITLALGGLIACAEPPIRSAPSHEKSLSVPAVITNAGPSVVTILTRDMPTTSTQAQSVSGGGIEGVLRHYYRLGQYQIYNLEDFWHSLRPFRDQPTIQRKNPQSMISLQHPSLSKAVP